MNKTCVSRVVTILMVLFIVVSTTSSSAEGKGKLVAVSLDVSGPSPGDNIFRGDFFTVTAHLKSDSPAKPGPLKVRIYLSSDRYGTDMKHELDIFDDVSLDRSGGVSVVKHEFDSFHDVSLDASGSVSVTGRYVMPYTIAPGDSYWIVVEVSPEEKAIESGENKTKITSGIIVPCDEFVVYNDSGHCSDKD